MRVDWIPYFKNNEQHGVMCECGRCIFLDESELTPPETHIECPICGFYIRYYTRTNVDDPLFNVCGIL